MKPSYASRHGEGLGPGTYNPVYFRDMLDTTRQSSCFKNKSERTPINGGTNPFQTDWINELGPGEYSQSLDTLVVHQPEKPQSAFANQRDRFDGTYRSAANRESEGKFCLSDLDSEKWEKTASISRLPRKQLLYRITQGADKFYDATPDFGERVQKSPVTIKYALASTKPRFPDSITQTTEFKNTRTQGPGSYSLKSSGVEVKDAQRMSSMFKSSTKRFSSSSGPVVDFWGWNYTHKSINDKNWHSNQGGRFSTSEMQQIVRRSKSAQGLPRRRRRKKQGYRVNEN